MSRVQSFDRDPEAPYSWGTPAALLSALNACYLSIKLVRNAKHSATSSGPVFASIALDE